MKIFVSLLLLGFAAVVAVQIRTATHDTALLRRAQWQTAEIFKDAIAQNESAVAPLRGDRTAAKIVFSKDSPNLAEYVDRGEGWQEIRPRGDVSLRLPGGVVVSSWTEWAPGNQMLALKTWRHGKGDVRIVPCTVALTSPAGAHADVHLEEDGSVWFH